MFSISKLRYLYLFYNEVYERMKSNVAITLFAQMMVVIFKIFMSSYYKYFGYILY